MLRTNTYNYQYETSQMFICGKSETEVTKLVTGTGGQGSKPSVYVCDKCIEIANDIISDDESPSPETPIK